MGALVVNVIVPAMISEGINWRWRPYLVPLYPCLAHFGKISPSPNFDECCFTPGGGVDSWWDGRD